MNQIDFDSFGSTPGNNHFYFPRSVIQYFLMCKKQPWKHCSNLPSSESVFLVIKFVWLKSGDMRFDADEDQLDDEKMTGLPDHWNWNDK